MHGLHTQLPPHYHEIHILFESKKYSDSNVVMKAFNLLILNAKLKWNRTLTFPSSGVLAKVIGKANDETTKPMVINIARSMLELGAPVCSVYRRAIIVGKGAKI